MNPLIPQFVKFCKKANIDLLDEDAAYVNRWVSIIPPDEVKAVLSAYLLEWRKGMGDELCALKKQGNGRRAANIWLQKECIGIARR